MRLQTQAVKQKENHSKHGNYRKCTYSCSKIFRVQDFKLRDLRSNYGKRKHDRFDLQICQRAIRHGITALQQSWVIELLRMTNINQLQTQMRRSQQSKRSQKSHWQTNYTFIRHQWRLIIRQINGVQWYAPALRLL